MLLFMFCTKVNVLSRRACFSKAYQECFGWESFQFGYRFVPNVESAALNKDKDAFEKPDLVLFLRGSEYRIYFFLKYTHTVLSGSTTPSVLCCPNEN